MLHGAVHTERDGAYIIEALTDEPGAMVVYHEGAMQHVAHAPCTNQGYAAAENGTGAGNESAQVTAPSKPHGRHGRGRRARVSDTTVCEVFLDADRSFLKQWGGEGTYPQRATRATLKMIDIIYQVDGIYQRPYNLANLLSMKIVGTMIHDYQFGGADGIVLLEHYQGWLTGFQPAPEGTCKRTRKYGTVGARNPRGQTVKSATDVCLNHLFTHSDAGGVLGVAIQANQASFLPGGICAELSCTDKNNTVIATNAAFTNTMGENGHLVPAWQSALSTAHEFGHNLGANHDCSRQPGDSASYVMPCNKRDGSKNFVADRYPPDNYGGPYLMYPAIGQSVSGSNSRILSIVSKREIVDVIAAKGKCLKSRSPCAAEDASCCDGIIAKPDAARCLHASSLTYGQCSNGICKPLSADYCFDMSVERPGDDYLESCHIKGKECVNTCYASASHTELARLKAIAQSTAQAYSASLKATSRLCATATNNNRTKEKCSDGKVTTQRLKGVHELAQWDEGNATGSCQVYSMKEAGSSCIANKAAVVGTCTREGVCSYNMSVSNRLLKSCRYIPNVATPCTQPCGGGTKMATFSCSCANPADVHVCNENPPPYNTTACSADACAVNHPKRVNIYLCKSADALVPALFQEAFKQLAGFPTRIVRIVRVAGYSAAAVQIESCRNDGNPSMCLSARQLKDTLTPIQDTIAQNLGHCVQVLSSSKHFESDEDVHIRSEAVAAICIALLATGLMLGAWLQGKQSRKAAAQRKRRLAKKTSLLSLTRSARSNGSRPGSIISHRSKPSPTRVTYLDAGGASIPILTSRPFSFKMAQNLDLRCVLVPAP